MYAYNTRIFLRDTDATGVLFFTEQMRIAVEVFENFLVDEGFPLGSALLQQTYLTPVVHVESDYFAPLRLSDPLEIHLSLHHVGTTSFTLDYRLYRESMEVGKVRVVHVAIDKAKGKKISIPEEFLQLLHKLS